MKLMKKYWEEANQGSVTNLNLLACGIVLRLRLMQSVVRFEIDKNVKNQGSQNISDYRY